MQSTKSRHKNMSAFCIANIFHKSRLDFKKHNDRQQANKNKHKRKIRMHK